MPAPTTAEPTPPAVTAPGAAETADEKIRDLETQLAALAGRMAELERQVASAKPAKRWFGRTS